MALTVRHAGLDPAPMNTGEGGYSMRPVFMDSAFAGMTNGATERPTPSRCGFRPLDSGPARAI